MKNKLKTKTMIDSPKKKKGKFGSRKSAIFQNPLMDLSIKKKFGINQTSNKERVYDLQFLEKVKLARENLIKIQKGSINNDYEIIGELGSGSYGAVKKVKHKKIKEVRAMKVILKKTENSKNEIDIMRKISL